jgi:thymidine kinase
MTAPRVKQFLRINPYTHTSTSPFAYHMSSPAPTSPAAPAAPDGSGPPSMLDVHRRFGDACILRSRPSGVRLTGFVGLICGPMFSGKTSALIRIHGHIAAANRRDPETPVRVRCFNYEADVRYGSATTIASHDADGATVEATAIGTAADVEPYIDSTDVFLINEGQFIDGMCDLAMRLRNMGKSVVVAGLDYDYKREPFPESKRLAHLLERDVRFTNMEFPDIMYCVAFCDHCKNAAARYTHRTSSEEEVVVIGGKEKYIPVCLDCWRRLNR